MTLAAFLSPELDPTCGLPRVAPQLCEAGRSAPSAVKKAACGRWGEH